MGKPLTTLGEALMAQGIDWRSEMRVENVPRRPPPESKLARPDRGHIEQPGEATPPSERRPEYADKPPEKTFIRRRIEDSAATSSPVALIRPSYTPGDRDVFPPPRSTIAAIADSAAEDDRARGVTARFSAIPFPPPLFPSNDAPAPLRAEPPRIEPPRIEPAQQTLVRLERAEPPFAPPPVPPRPVFAKRASYTLAFKLAAVERVRRGERQKDVADDLGLCASVISQWTSGQGLTRNRRVPVSLADRTKERDLPQMKKAKTLRRKHSDETRADAVRRFRAGELARDVAASHGVSTAQVYKWAQRDEQALGKPRAKAKAAPAAPASEGGGLLDRLIESRIEKRLEELLDKKLTEVLERKLGKL